MGFWSVMTDKILPTVARTIRSGGPYLNDLIMASYCQKEAMLGSAVVGTDVVPSSTTLEVFPAVLFQSGDVVSLPFCQELVASELLLDEDTRVGNITASSSRINGRWMLSRGLSITALHFTTTLAYINPFHNSAKQITQNT